MVLDVTHLVILDANDAFVARGSRRPRVRLLDEGRSRCLESRRHQRTRSIFGRPHVESRRPLLRGARQQQTCRVCVDRFSTRSTRKSNRGASLLTGVGVSFPASICFMYKGFVHREFRGRQIYGRLMSRALTALAGRKITHMLSTAEWTNFSALKSCYRIGFRYLGLIWRFGYSWRMCTVTP